jgi:hypothetical protein
LWINQSTQPGKKFPKDVLDDGKTELSTESKILLYKTTLKPIWTYGIPLWGAASNSNIEILQRFQNKVLRTIADAPWYVPSTVLHKDLGIPTIREEIKKFQ